MRIIAGKFGGYSLVSPASQKIRPTTDRVRESLFAILSGRYSGFLENAKVIDLFAGTGALGLEAISRGAQFSVFVEVSKEACTLIRKNIDHLKLDDKTKILRADATRLRAVDGSNRFDLVFADPPYGKRLAERTIRCILDGGWLSSDAMIIIEAKASEPPPVTPFCELLDERKFGNTKLYFLRTH